eukprot:CAMPEP_0205816674 /NCGR_PEP_ID=MMETSP0205-20121125/23150_1 /ASSEMBLY_ACC=CAM_ASM_000278 /TAXON_ID=36767 /ORGANISM="Euplotes focardii, Strain TN1" /LENGTH=70 /DNA_ID=CAMNT_0053105633 /DNA_START=494 /DNA_END=706 /DNA_ORIENTATION=-
MTKYMNEAKPEFKERRKQEEDEEYGARNRDSEKEKDQDQQDKPKEENDQAARDQTSQERRDMIASWNVES